MTYDDNIQALLSAASIVRDETHEGGNTAARVGQLLVDMITSFDSAYKALSDSIPEGVDLSILKSYLSKEEAETLFDTQSVFNRLFVEDTTNNAIKALKHLYSVSDITAFGYVKTELPSEGVGSFGELSEVLALGAQSGTKYWGWNGTDYAWLSAPAGGAVDLSEYPKRNEFAALTLKVNGLYEQYLPLGTSIGLDLDAVYVKKSEGGNVNPDNYYTKSETENYVQGQITALNIDQYATDEELWALSSILDNNVSALTTAIAQAQADAKSYAYEQANSALVNANLYTDYKLVNYVDLTSYQVIEGQKVFNAFTRIGIPEGYRTDLDAGNIGLRAEYPCIDFCKGEINPFYDYSVRLIEHTKGILEIWEAEDNPRLVIGGAMLSYDSGNKSLKISDINGGGSINLYATGDISAFSGLGSYDTLMDLTLTNSLTVEKKLLIGTNSLSLDKYGALVIDGGEQEEIYFRGVCYFDSDLELGFVAASEAFFNEASIEELYIGESPYPITSLTADGSKVYITINGTKYTLTPTNIETITQ